MKKSILLRRPVSSCTLLAPCIWLAGTLVFLLCVQVSGNFHNVVAGELYRSAQPTGDQLESYIREHGIKSIVNLRGAEDRDWYRDETAIAKRLSVEHIDFKMSATTMVSTEQAEALVALLKAAPKPILLHCRSGSDRTGIAAALYSREIAGMDESIAERQLSLYYGHIAIPYLSAAYAMDESWERLSKHFEMNSGRTGHVEQANPDSSTGMLVAKAESDDGVDWW